MHSSGPDACRPDPPPPAESAGCASDASARFPVAIQAASCSRPPPGAAPAPAPGKAAAAAAVFEGPAAALEGGRCTCAGSDPARAARRPAAAARALAIAAVALVPSSASMAVASSARNAASWADTMEQASAMRQYWSWRSACSFSCHGVLCGWVGCNGIQAAGKRPRRARVEEMTRPRPAAQLPCHHVLTFQMHVHQYHLLSHALQRSAPEHSNDNVKSAWWGRIGGSTQTQQVQCTRIKHMPNQPLTAWQASQPHPAAPPTRPGPPSPPPPPRRPPPAKQARPAPTAAAPARAPAAGGCPSPTAPGRPR